MSRVVGVSVVVFLSLIRNVVEGTELVFTDTKTNLFRALKSSILLRRDAGESLTFQQSFQIGFLANFLLPELERSECSAWDSCVLRCGDPILGAPYLCSCDPNCVKYNDCCVDYNYYCVPPADNSTKVMTTGPAQDEYLCKPWLGWGKYYGVWRVNGIYTMRKCMRETPPWCNPAFKPLLTWDYTQSLSILLNFGPEGWNTDLLFSSDFYDPDKCPKTWEIWDPFTEVCRPIECSDDFVLENGKCVWDGDGSPPPSATDLLSFVSKEASISFHGNILMEEILAPLAMSVMRLDMASSLAKKMRVGMDRISNTTIQKDDNPSKSPIVELPGFNETEGVTIPGADEWHLWVLSESGFPVTVNFTMRRKDANATSELTIEQFLSVLHEAVALRGVLRTISGIPMKINSVEKHLLKEEIDFFENWCKGGDLKSYWNEEFDPVVVFKAPETEGGMPEMQMNVKILETNQTIQQGHYVANLLFQSTNTSADMANVSGVVIVCENRPQIMDLTCPRIDLNVTDFSINDDGTIEYEGEIPGLKEVFNRTEYEYTEDGNIRVCIDYDTAKSKADTRILTVAEQIASLLTLILISLSLMCLAFAILTYGLFSELRTLPGCCVLNFSLSKFVFFLLFIMGARPSASEHDTGCIAVAILLHLSALFFFAWSSVISYDLFATFTRFQTVSRSKEKYLLRYCLAAYGLPALVVFIAMMVDFHSNVGISYGKNVCWIGNSMAALYVFGLPIASSVILNAVFFALTIRGIRRISKQVASRIQGENRRFVVFVRMSSVQCFAWVFGFLAVFTHFSEILSRIFEFLFLILSALQGLYIFVAFICNERVKRLYQCLWSGKYDWRRQMTVGEKSGSRSTTVVRGPIRKANLKRSADVLEQQSRLGRDDTSATTGKNRNVMAGRTVSNETCISFVSTT